MSESGRIRQEGRRTDYLKNRPRPEESSVAESGKSREHEAAFVDRRGYARRGKRGARVRTTLLRLNFRLPTPNFRKLDSGRLPPTSGSRKLEVEIQLPRHFRKLNPKFRPPTSGSWKFRVDLQPPALSLHLPTPENRISDFQFPTSGSGKLEV